MIAHVAPIAGQRIADEVWKAYSETWEAYQRGRATVEQVRTARLAYDAAETAKQRALRGDRGHNARSHFRTK